MSERRSAVRAVRGATTVPADDPAELRAATRELLETIAARNALAPRDVISAIFTVTDDLASENPARAARALGWTDVPLLCVREMTAADGPRRCVRVLLHVETDRPRDAIVHVYLNDARSLRPDLALDE
jgi:chorismate mutase